MKLSLQVYRVNAISASRSFNPCRILLLMKRLLS